MPPSITTLEQHLLLTLNILFIYNVFIKLMSVDKVLLKSRWLRHYFRSVVWWQTVKKPWPMSVIAVVKLMRPTAVGFIRYGHLRSDRIETARFVWFVLTFKKLILCIHRVVGVRNNGCKLHRLVWERCRDISVWNSGWWSLLKFGIW